MDDFKLKYLTNGMSSISNYIFFQQYTHCFVVWYLNISIYTVRVRAWSDYTDFIYRSVILTLKLKIKMTLLNFDKHYHESADLYNVSVSELANVLPRLKLWFIIYVFCLISTECDLFRNMTVIPSMNLHGNTTGSVLYTPNHHLFFTCFCYDFC